MDAARFAAMSDPARNFHFSRGWSEPPPSERKRPAIVGTIVRAASESFITTAENNDAARLIQWASAIDRQADADLAIGRVASAERLSQMAAELREGAR